MPIGEVKLDGSQTVLFTGRTATASTDAGWLAITTIQQRNVGVANVMREVYILNKNGDELTVWRTLNVSRPGGLDDWAAGVDSRFVDDDEDKAPAKRDLTWVLALGLFAVALVELGRDWSGLHAARREWAAL